MRWTSMGILILISSMVGSVSFGLWKFGSRILERQGRIRGIRAGLTVALLFFVFPILLCFRQGGLAGLYGERSPLSFWKSPSLALAAGFFFILWAGGALLALARYWREKRMVRCLLGWRKPAEEEIRKMAESLRKRLHIRRKIPVYTVRGLSGPWIAGVWRCRIFLPEKRYKEEELQIILEHELWHYKQGDLLLKIVCTWISWIQWFHPLAKRLPEEVDKWGEIHCDLQMCYGQKRSWNRKQYFQVVIDHAPEEEVVSSSGMRLKTGREELEERMKKMKEYRPEKELARFTVFLFLLCFLCTGAVTCLAATKGATALYNLACETSEKLVGEGHLTLSGKKRNGEIVETYLWTLTGGQEKQTGTFYGSAGSQVAVLLSPDSEGGATGFGLEEPDGALRGVMGEGICSYTFLIQKDGAHRVYVRNEGNSPLDLWITIVRSAF
ncbi:MAG: M56 family metallopeptidase [Lachnospiraceae bacterium]|nr:M56 family metallopeptidase [Lachnospiraceae bacterium]